ncbi:MAG: hypothetical protein JSR33_11320 [Proteobacteria bacterium]|nr:hypothetical protein [Pseudomonadota bacterium]
MLVREQAFGLKELNHKINGLDQKMTFKIELVRRDLKIWFGGMLVTLVVVFPAVQALLAHLGR